MDVSFYGNVLNYTNNEKYFEADNCSSARACKRARRALRREVKRISTR